MDITFGTLLSQRRHLLQLATPMSDNISESVGLIPGLPADKTNTACISH